MEWAGRFLIGVVAVVAMVFFFGGYVYKTTCPLPSGSTQTSWTSGFDDILPYIRSTNAPCSSHTGTRLALDWIGVWSLGNSTKTVTITSADRAAADGLRVATSSLTASAARVAAYGKKNGGAALTPAFRARFIRFNNETVALWQRVKTALDRPTKADDPQLIDARKSVSAYAALLIASDRLFFASKSIKDYYAKLQAAYGSTYGPLLQHLRYLALVVPSRYPQVKDWGFVPAK